MITEYLAAGRELRLSAVPAGDLSNLVGGCQIQPNL
jgi:hypothetical protein